MPPQSLDVVPRRSLEVWNVWALIATLFASTVLATPFLSAPLMTTKAFLLAEGAIITLVLFIAARFSRGSVIVPPLALVGALWLPVLAYALSTAFSGVPLATALWGTALEVDTLGFMIAAATLGTLTALVLRRVEHYQTFLRAGAGAFVVVAVLQLLIVIVGQLAPQTISPAFSLVGSFEDLAYLLGLGVTGVLVTVRFVELSLRSRRALVVATVIALFLLAIANSTIVWIMVALVSLGLFIESAMMRKSVVDEDDLDNVSLMDESSLGTDSGARSVTLPLPVLAVAIFFLVGGALSGALANALHVNVVSVSPSWQSTLAIAQKTYSAAPIFGTGPGTFGVEWLKHRDPSLNTTVFWNTDFRAGIGFIPTSFVTTGLLGALCWILFFGLFVVLGLRTLISRTPHDPSVRYAAVLSFVMTAYLFVIAVFALPGAVILALTFVCAGLFTSTMRFAEQGRQRGLIFSRSPRLGFVVVFSLTLLMFASVVVAYALVERYLAVLSLTNAQVAFSKGDVAKAEQDVQSAISFAPSSAAYQAQADIAIVRLGQIAASTTMPATVAQQAFQATLSTGINAAITATRLAPSEYQTWLALGNLYAQAVPLNVSGAYESAKTAYDKAQALNPTSPEILYVVAQLNIAHKDFAAAKADLKSAIALKQDYLDAIFLLSQLEVQSGNVKEALDAAVSAAYFAPNDPNVRFQVGVLRAASGDYAGAVVELSAAVAVNKQFANARYFLAAVYAKQSNFAGAIEELQEIAALSAENTSAVAPLITALEAGRNPFPANLLSAATPPAS
ncbi:MAG: tetratricopeptide repeat protein [Candidatus Paceibacterota bacterium]